MEIGGGPFGGILTVYEQKYASSRHMVLGGYLIERHCLTEVVYLLILVLFHRLVRRVSQRGSGEVLKMKYCHLRHCLAARWTTAPTKKKEAPLIKANSIIVKYARKFTIRGVTIVYI